MSDLISRSKAISVLEQLEEHSLTGKMDISNAIYLLNNQPTAYDVEKVVKELLELNKNYNDGINLNEEVAEIPTEEAIEIVRQGNVKAEDVCKWTPNDKFGRLNTFNVGCCGKILDLTVRRALEMDSCPYCNRKIRVM